MRTRRAASLSPTAAILNGRSEEGRNGSAEEAPPTPPKTFTLFQHRFLPQTASPPKNTSNEGNNCQNSLKKMNKAAASPHKGRSLNAQFVRQKKKSPQLLTTKHSPQGSRRSKQTIQCRQLRQLVLSSKGRAVRRVYIRPLRGDRSAGIEKTSA